MRYYKKIISFILVLSLVFSSKSFITYADNDNESILETSFDLIDEETIINDDDEESSAYDEEPEEDKETEESEGDDKIEFEPEEDEETQSEETDQNETAFEENNINETTINELSIEETSSDETAFEENIIDETTINELSIEETSSDEIAFEESIIDETTINETSIEETSSDETTTIVSTAKDETLNLDIIKDENKTPLFGEDPKFRFAYFKEDMSIGLYTFDFAGFSVIPDSLTIAVNELEAIKYHDKRYNGAVDLGIENYNIGALENTYKWDDSRIYSDSQIDLFDAYQSWCTSSTLEDKLLCANYAKLSEMSIVKNTVDTEYYIGENFNPSGLKIDVKFTNDETDTIEYSDSTKDHFKFYDDSTGDEYTTSTVMSSDFTLKIVYGDVEHGSDAISTVSSTINIIVLDPSADKGYKVYCQKLDDTIECIDYVDGMSSGEFTESVRELINGEDVKSDAIAYQGYYFLNTYSGNDYDAYRTWNDTDVFSFESDFQKNVQEWIDGGKTENKAVGIILQKRQYEDENGNLYIWHLNADSEIIKETFTEIVRMDEFDAFIQELNDGTPSQYNSITGYYKDAYIDYQFYRPDRKPTEEYSGFRDLLIEWKEKPNLFSFSDSRKVCIAYERKTPDSISVLIPPKKVSYQTGEKFNPEGLVILASYPGDINDEVPCDDFRDYLFSFNPTTDVELNGTNDKITITCLSKSFDLPIYVEPAVASISICKMISFDTYSVGEKIDLDGLSITVNYDNGSSKEVAYSEYKSFFAFDPDINNAFQASDVGTKTYTITYGSKQTTFNVNALENNKFVIHYDVGGNIESKYLVASTSDIENVLNQVMQNGYDGFYNINASGFKESIKKYDKTTVMTMTKDEAITLYNSFDGKSGLFIGAAVKSPAPAPTPTPYNPGGSGGSSGGGGGGGGGSSGGPIIDLPKTVSAVEQKDSKLNQSNNIPQNELIMNVPLAIDLLSIPENEIIPKQNFVDSNGNTGFGKWLNVPGSDNWLFLAGDFLSMIESGSAGFISDGLYNLSWGEKNGWYSFSVLGIMQTGWQEIDGKKYYFEPNPSVADFGMASVGTKIIDGKTCNFDTNGVLIELESLNKSQVFTK